ncbi:restriction endonuclease subunit S [Erwinia sp. S38]|uniref:restriction endonuclease subunit S n=1 Tax=Erwinia sp. S38 TaxID=2769338 RepID=UPI00190D3074|nr:restriction endonuclease subunit S [Erwinia sp. S38]MBK0003513.1 restriction endonuclease subunit S [Erwinia sp. S38]
MSSNWTVKKLGELVTFLSGGTPSKSNKDYWNGEIPWISASSMQSTRYQDSDLRVTSLGCTNGTRRVPAGTVLLLVRGGALHNKIPVGITTREVTFNQDVKALVPKSEDITPYYLLAWLISSRELLLDKVENTGIGAGKLDTKVLQELEVSVPPKADLLRLELFSKALDDKIILNEDINKTLEQIAQALFKSWFVDFEPVKAKIAVLEAGGSQEDATLAAMTAISGKDADALVVFEREYPEQYAELKAAAELFPSAMQDSELGEIPEGWYVSDLSEVASLNAESWSKKNAPESVSYVDLANTKWGVINSIETYQFSDAPSRARRILKPHDTIVGTVRPGNGSYSYINKTGLTGSTGFAVLTPKARVFSEYIYLCVTSKESIERLAHLADGGAYPAVNADVVLSTQCVLPLERKKLESLLKIFSSRTGVFFSYRANNLDQNEVLTNTRDTLLPKLLSGEITLPAAEQAVSEVENV